MVFCVRLLAAFFLTGFFLAGDLALLALAALLLFLLFALAAL